MEKKCLNNKLKKRYYIFLGFNLKTLMLKSLDSKTNSELNEDNSTDSNVIITTIS